MNIMTKRTIARLLLLPMFALTLTGCGGGGSTTATTTEGGITTAGTTTKPTTGTTAAAATTTVTTTAATTAATTKPTGPATLAGKTFVFLGSSVTCGFNDNWSMCEYLAENHDCTVKKWAVGGTSLVDNGSNSYVQRMLKEMKTQKECDHFVCQLSTNDAGQQNPLGTISESFDMNDFDTSTIIGAMEFIIAAAKKKWDCPISFYTNPWYGNAHYQSMVDVMPELQKKWGIGVLDFWNDQEIMDEMLGDSRYMRDAVHPTHQGYEVWIGPKFAKYLLAAQ